MKLSLNTIRTGAMASVLASSAVSCADLTKQEELCDKAKNTAIEYLTGEEYLQAEDANKCASYPSRNKLVNYWDSIATEYKVQRAYLEGAQMIRDSVAGKNYTKTEYKMPEKQEEEGFPVLIENLTKEIAANTDAKTIRQLIQKQPKISAKEENSEFLSNKGWRNLHFWNEVIATGKQRKAFDDGANAERAKLNK